MNQFQLELSDDWEENIDDISRCYQVDKECYLLWPCYEGSTPLLLSSKTGKFRVVDGEFSFLNSSATFDLIKHDSDYILGLMDGDDNCSLNSLEVGTNEGMRRKSLQDCGSPMFLLNIGPDHDKRLLGINQEGEMFDIDPLENKMNRICIIDSELITKIEGEEEEEKNEEAWSPSTEVQHAFQISRDEVGIKSGDDWFALKLIGFSRIQKEDDEGCEEEEEQEELRAIVHPISLMNSEPSPIEENNLEEEKEDDSEVIEIESTIVPFPQISSSFVSIPLYSSENQPTAFASSLLSDNDFERGVPLFAPSAPFRTYKQLLEDDEALQAYIEGKEGMKSFLVSYGGVPMTEGESGSIFSLIFSSSPQPETDASSRPNTSSKKGTKKENSEDGVDLSTLEPFIPRYEMFWSMVATRNDTSLNIVNSNLVWMEELRGVGVVGGVPCLYNSKSNVLEQNMESSSPPFSLLSFDETPPVSWLK